MTYLERITYLVGNFIQLSQYVLKNAYRVSTLYQNSLRLDCYTKGDEMIVQSEEMAKKLLKEQEGLSSKELSLYFKDKGLSDKDYRDLTRILLKRDYVVSSFFVENAYALSREEIAVYESKISELEELSRDCSVLIGRLSKESDRMYARFQK